MGELIQFPQRGVREHPVSRAELQRILGVSERWIRYRVSEGMPSQGLQGYRHSRRFLVSEVRAWIESRDQAGEAR